MSKIHQFLVRLFVCIAISGSVLPSENAFASLPEVEVNQLREVFSSISDTTGDLRNALDRYFTDRRRKDLSEKLLELNVEAIEIFASLEFSVRSRATALEFSDLVTEYFNTFKIIVSSSYIDWPFAGFDIDGADHLDQGSKDQITANKKLHLVRLSLLKRHGLNPNEANVIDENL